MFAARLRRFFLAITATFFLQGVCGKKSVTVTKWRQPKFIGALCCIWYKVVVVFLYSVMYIAVLHTGMRASGNKTATILYRVLGRKYVLKSLIKEWAWMFVTVANCFGLAGSHQHGTANNQAQVVTENTWSIRVSVSLVDVAGRTNIYILPIASVTLLRYSVLYFSVYCRFETN